MEERKVTVTGDIEGVLSFESEKEREETKENIKESGEDKKRNILFKIKLGLIIASILIVIGVVGYYILNYHYDKQYESCIKAAKECMQKKQYDKAIDILKDGKKLKHTNIEETSKLLADNYVKCEKYNNALEELLYAYKKTSNKELYDTYMKIKNKKETIVYERLLKEAKALEKTDAKKEDKIMAYKNAIDANSVKTEAYIAISNIYIKSKEYDKAIKLLQEGIEFCKFANETIEDNNIIPLSVQSNETVKKSIDTFSSKIKEFKNLIVEDKYNKIYAKAKEAYNKKDANSLEDYYKESIKIKPVDDRMYLLFAKSYFENYMYDDAIKILNEGISAFAKEGRKVENSQLEKTLKDYNAIKSKIDAYNKMYNSIYKECNSCLKNGNEKNIIKILNNKDFKYMAYVSKQTYYKDGRFVEKGVSGNNVLIVYSNNKMYYGEIKDNKRVGKGLFIAVSNENYCMYTGNWNNDMPNGNGKVKQVVNGKVESETSGNYLDGYENGKMTIKKSYGIMEYTARKGVPVPIKGDDGKDATTIDGKLVIGYYMKDGKKNQAASISKETIWKVEGLEYK